MSRSTTKSTKLPVRTAKTQTSPVWLESSLCVFFGTQRPNASSCGQRRLWSDWADAQGDLNRRWAHSYFVGFTMLWLINETIEGLVDELLYIWTKRKLLSNKTKRMPVNFPFLQKDKHPSHWYEIWAASWQFQQIECAPSEDSDQPGHPPSLIRVLAVRMKKAWTFSYPLSAQRRLWSDWADTQADQSLRWAHSHIAGFVTRRLVLWFTP